MELVSVGAWECLGFAQCSLMRRVSHERCAVQAGL